MATKSKEEKNSSMISITQWPRCNDNIFSLKQLILGEIIDCLPLFQN